VPQVGVDSEWGVSVVQPACVRKHGDPAEQGVAHEEGEQSPADPGTAEPGISGKDVHGDAAELKGKIPPVVCAASQREGERVLFPDLAAQHEETAQEKEPVRERGEIFFSERAQSFHVGVSFQCCIFCAADCPVLRASGQAGADIRGLYPIL